MAGKKSKSGAAKKGAKGSGGALKERLGVIGAGVIGSALVRGGIDAGLLHPSRVWAATKSEESRREAAKELGVSVLTDYDSELARTDVVLICVKPAQMSQVLATLKSKGLRRDALVISVAAGVTIERMGRELGGSQPLVRAMTNTPCVIRQGITALAAGATAQSKHMTLAHRLFGAVGRCIDLEERLLDAYTGLAGSGPAYLYLIIEALADGGVNVGIPRKTALEVVAQTVLGSARMVQESGRSPAALKDDVTTPAGCTIGGLLKLEEGNLRSVLAQAVAEATRIASKLG
ncbi:MAG: pyrroline-5-carboxylate reductase [Bdellovibrionales bacterium]|nr:pyrroline-5-carboxylate reductase [Bdellovibrionales bacterium]